MRCILDYYIYWLRGEFFYILFFFLWALCSVGFLLLYFGVWELFLVFVVLISELYKKLPLVCLVVFFREYGLV